MDTHSRSSNLVVIGASAGGVMALQRLVSLLPAGFPAPIVVVLHIGPHKSGMARVLAGSGPLEASVAEDGECMQAGHIYVAPHDRHVLVEGSLLRLHRGPKEHHTRPAIDPLFRSAALSRGPEVIGVILTGMLDDGTAGLQAIKRHGGLAVVQDPSTAHAPSMPASAMRYVEVDHCLPLEQIPHVLAALAASESNAPHAKARRECHEQELFLMRGHPMEHMQEIAAPSTFACPDCHGALWRIEGAAPLRFRCHTGHAFTLRSLVDAQGTGTEEAVWSAIRSVQERQLLLELTATQAEMEMDVTASEKARADARGLARLAKTMMDLTEAMPAE